MESFTLDIKALTRTRCCIVIIFIISLLLISVGAVLIFSIKLYESGIYLSRRELIFICIIAGILVFICSACLSKFISKKFIILFEESQISIFDGKNKKIISYSEILSVFIINNTDYSRIKFVLSDNNSYVFYVGLCYMLQAKKQVILQNSSQLDVFFKNFEKEAGGKRGSNSIVYLRKNSY